jgi:hypothetical protein
MKIIQASFFWKNDQPGGIGLTFGPPSFSPEQLEEAFNGEIVKTYLRESDQALGTSLVDDYLAQLSAIGQAKQQGRLTMKMGILAALNIIWLTERGFLAQDEFNGYQLIKAQT